MKYLPLAIFACAAACMLGGTVFAQELAAHLKAEGANALAKAARERGSAVRGAILFPQQKFACAGCHATGSENLLGPDLGKLGAEATDVYIAEALLEPSKVIKKGYETVTIITAAGKTHAGRIVEQTEEKIVLRETAAGQRLITVAKNEIDELLPSKKSAMPDNLLDQLASRQQFLDLVKYVIELKTAGAGSNTAGIAHALGGGELSDELRGVVLLDNLKCTACHRTRLPHSNLPPKQAPILSWGVGRIAPRYIERFIADPLMVKPGTTMPGLLGDVDADTRRTIARQITHYLVSLGETAFEQQPLDGAAAQRGAEQFHSVGCVACHSPRDKNGAELMAKESVPLGELQDKYNLAGLVAFLENPHAARPSGRMPNMQLTHWEAIDIASYLLSRSKSEAPHSEPFRLDQSLAEEGKQQFARLGCKQCHANEMRIDEREYPPLTSARSDRGCLSGKQGKWPHYDLTEAERRSMRAALANAPQELTGQQQIAVTLTALRCVACHQRDDLGGISPERDEYFHTTNPNLGPQGRIPPTLTGVGAKLKPKWLRQVLVEGRSIRPYMKTRMPRFGTENVEHLVNLFQQTDQLPEVTHAKFSDQKEIRKVGHEMAGSGGLNCIACHTFQRKRAATMPAVDLTEMAERLHKDWFYHYLRSPQQLSPRTVMPSFWPGGRAIRKDILDGDPDLQIEALWQYLLDGRQARTPRGLIREPIELLAGDEAVMLRRSYGGIGKRGIGVGFPSQINLAFDAEQMRLALLWKGKFADPGAVWRGQGSGAVRPLGTDLVRFAKGPELDDARQPWIVDDGRPPQHRFKGYYLDSLQRPTFMYRFDTVDVEDYPVDVKDEKSGDILIRRTITLTSKTSRENVVFRAAADNSIVPQGKGTFLIGKTLRIRIDDKHKAAIVETGQGKQLQIPLSVGRGPSKLVLEYRW